MRIAIHQPNWIPWFPYFQKMEQCDKFVFLTHCKFSKNGVQNRQKINGKFWTNPVKSDSELIKYKVYSNGERLQDLNVLWIEAIARTLDIDTKKIAYDYVTELTGTDRIIDICKHFDADEYLADEKAPEKYLDLNQLYESGIQFVPFKSNFKKHVFEIFDEMGIEKARKVIKCRT